MQISSIYVDTVYIMVCNVCCIQQIPSQEHGRYTTPSQERGMYTADSFTSSIRIQLYAYVESNEVFNMLKR